MKRKAVSNQLYRVIPACAGNMLSLTIADLQPGATILSAVIKSLPSDPTTQKSVPDGG